MTSANTLAFLATLHVKAATFTAFVLGIVYLARHSSSQNRYLVLKMALGVLAVLPLLVLILPSYLVPVDRYFVDWWPSPPTDITTTVLRADATNGESVTLAERPFSTEAVLLTGYFAVTAFLLLRIGVGFQHARIEIRRYRRIDEAGVIALLNQVRRRLDVEQDVELIADLSGAGPYVWGIQKQVIAVPKEFSTAAPDIQRTVLTHELIHVVRRDTAICLISRILCCLYWINPALWLLNVRLKLEMEQSCDDRAVCSGINAADYAGHLLNAIAQFDVTHRPSSAVAMARASSVKYRIRSLLNNHRRRAIMSTSKSRCIFSALVLAGAAIGALAAKPETDAALLASVRSLLPENCDAYDVRLAGDITEIKGYCANATGVKTFMRSLERAGGMPFMRSMHSANGQDFDMRLENLQSFAPVPTLETEATLLTGVKGLVPENCDANEIRVVADVIEIKGHCAIVTSISAFMRSLERAGGKPSLSFVKKGDSGLDFKMRLENLQSFARISGASTSGP